ncbi:unnamed protein product [Clonostachys byssicola]|uniref:Uncharacterized protein n=1 Tax=Clonostachys byssicola TaxID=160290 RepID=A0A9N9UEL6_9HYPO|nr:unnamed protein product [Clonostachys byssicola]
MLPAEIRYEIVSHFVYTDNEGFPGGVSFQRYGVDWDDFMPLRPPRPIKDHMRGPFKDRADVGRFRTVTTKFYRDEADLRMLCKLRLVSREWLATVDPFLQKWSTLRIDVGSRQTMERLAKVMRPSFPAKKLVIPCIEAALAFTRRYTYAQGADHDVEEVEDYKDEPLNGNSHNFAAMPDAPPEKPFVGSQDIDLLETIWNNLPQIESFTLIFPQSGATFDNGWNGSADFYDMEVVNASLSFFKKALSSPMCSQLTDLRLHLPCTHNVGQICEGLGQDARNQILHLEICIMDASGISGDREHLFFDSPGDYRELDGDVHIYNSVPYSNMQRECSNQEHQDELWEFAGSCPNLLSLHIVGTNFLDLDRFHWKKAPDSRGLRVLSLERVWLSVSSLEALLQPSPSAADATPHLRRISLGDVKLRVDGGNWEDIFNSLREGYPDLELSCMDQLTYFENHPRYTSPQSPWDCVWKIESEEESDSRAAYALAKHVAERAGGWEHYPIARHESASEYNLHED